MNVLETLLRGPRTSREIQALAGVSQASVSRAVREDPSIIKLPGSAPHQYAAIKAAFGAGELIPIAAVDSRGKTEQRAVLSSLQPRGYVARLLPGASNLMAGESTNGLFETLPYYLDDARPQGFLGKLIAENLSEQSDDFVANPDNWSEDMVGRYLISNGDNLPGDFVFGEPMMNRLRSKPVAQSRSSYSQIATETMAGYAGESFAGGEQPKFTAFISDIDSHVIVKFSPIQDDIAARRWRDILVTEYHALTVLAEHGFNAADTRLFEQEGRYFLESKRFDRLGATGRSSMVSLRTVDAEFTGVGGNWTDVGDALHESKFISELDLHKIKGLELFGKLINNTDMHLGNLSLSFDNNRFSLLPAYDMCSMGFAPKGTEVTDLQFRSLEKVLSENNLDADVLRAAVEFWDRVLSDKLTSDELKDFISRTKPASAIEKLLPKP